MERYFRISTTGYVSPVSNGGTHYTPLPYQILWKMFKHLDLRAADVNEHIACGKGRVICCACRTPVGRVVGIEVNDKLANEARQNLRNVRGCRSQTEVLSIYAEKYDYADATVLYLYNPFDEAIFRKTLAKVDASFRAHPRPFRIVYANNMYERPLEELGWLRKYQEWPAEAFPAFGYPIAFWASPKQSSSNNALNMDMVDAGMPT